MMMTMGGWSSVSELVMSQPDLVHITNIRAGLLLVFMPLDVSSCHKQEVILYK